MKSSVWLELEKQEVSCCWRNSTLIKTLIFKKLYLAIRTADLVITRNLEIWGFQIDFETYIKIFLTQSN